MKVTELFGSAEPHFWPIGRTLHNFHTVSVEEREILSPNFFREIISLVTYLVNAFTKFLSNSVRVNFSLTEKIFRQINSL